MSEENDKPRPRLAFTRRYGWVVVEWLPWTPLVENARCVWLIRGSYRRQVLEKDILAWADLPPAPEAAA